MWKKNRSSQPSKENPLAKHIEAFKIARSSSSKWIRPCYAEWDHATQITVRNLENHEIKGEVPLYKLLLEIRHLHIPKNPKNFRFGESKTLEMRSKCKNKEIYQNPPGESKTNQVGSHDKHVYVDRIQFATLTWWRMQISS